jgi:UDP-glucose 4-epimerase
MSTYAITGIAGFLGSAVARALVCRGAMVRGIDDLSTGSVENLEEIVQQIDFTVGDIRDGVALSSLCEGADYVLHFACGGMQSQTQEQISETNQINVEGTLKVLVAARAAKVRRVVLASSAALYAIGSSVKHEATGLNLGSAYTVSKRAAEEYAQCFHRIYGLETVSLRLFHVYGPGQDLRSRYSAAIMRLISEILHGETPTIYGDGETVRDLMYVEDAVEATLRACTAPGFRVAGRIINVGSGVGISQNQVFSELRKALGYKGVLVYGPERRALVRNIVADTKLYRRALGFVGSTDLVVGVDASASWLRRRANLSNLAVH